MSGAESGIAGTGAVSKPDLPAKGRETQELVDRACKGDRSCLPAIRALLADDDRGRFYRETYGSSADWLRRTIVRRTAGENVLAQEAIVQKIESVQAELAGPDPSPIERLLAERAALCWMMVNWHENSI